MPTHDLKPSVRQLMLCDEVEVSPRRITYTVHFLTWNGMKCTMKDAPRYDFWSWVQPLSLPGEDCSDYLTG